METPNIVKFQITLNSNIESLKKVVNNFNGFESFKKKYQKAINSGGKTTLCLIAYTLIILIIDAILILGFSDTFFNDLGQGNTNYTILYICSIALSCIPSFIIIPPLLSIKRSFDSVDRAGLYNYYIYLIEQLEIINRQIATIDKSYLSNSTYIQILHNVGNNILAIVDRIENLTDDKKDKNALDDTNITKRDWEIAFNYSREFINYLDDNGTNFLAFSQKYLLK